MKILVLDLETTVQKLNDKKDNSPFHPDNWCVSAHFGWLGWGTVDDVQNLVFNHNDKQGSDPIGPLEAALAEADMLVAHNAKFDCLWLQEMGLVLPPKIYCTMIGEYILAKGQRQELSLKATAERRNVTRKKSDLVDELFKKGTGFEAMPLETVLEYAEADVISCGEIYLAQQDDFSADHNKSLTNIVELMNEMLIFLLEIESNGICIDMQALDEVEQLFSAEKAELERSLNRIVEEVMGDTPINLNSGADMTAVVYSRRVRDRSLHQQVFNIGLNPAGKPLQRPRMNQQEFARSVRTTTDVVYRTMAVCCHECNGVGKVYRTKKDGNFYSRSSMCKPCKGAGAIYESTGKVAGLKLKPLNVQYATINGFAADKETIKLLIVQAREKDNLQAEEFLTKLSRLNAVSTYLDSFVQGIRTWTRHDGILHTNMNQTIAATGRLSSSNPNFQNQPKRGFPIRKAVISRFEGGCIIEADFSGLEFRVAGEVSRDPQIIEDIMNGKDVHKQTASIINRCKPEEVGKDMRQNAKAFCVPLDTEILTREGWKTYGQISLGEYVMTYNSVTRSCEWGPVRDVAFFKDEEVHEFGHSSWRVRATPNHRWYGWKRTEGAAGVRKNVPCVFTTEDITSEHHIISAAFCADGGDLPMSKEELCILTWVVTDGTYKHSELSGLTSQGSDGRRRGCTAFIVQKKADQCLSIEHLLRDVEATRYQDDNGTCRWYLPAKYFRLLWEKSGLDHYNPDWVQLVLRMSPEQRSAFIDTFYKAEGTPREHGERRFSQNAGSLSDALRLAIHLDGHDSRITRRVSYTGKVHEIVTERKKAHVTTQRFRTTSKSVEDVWCPRTDNGTWVMRQGNVITITGNTFAPLYGGMGAAEPPHIQEYFKQFFVIYKGLAEYQKRLMDGVLRNGIVQTPSGRQYYWPNVRRLKNGRTSNATQIVNYPIQGFATGDLVPLACIRAFTAFKGLKLLSKLILTVHDSIVVDCFPGEEEQVCAVLKEAMMGVSDEAYRRWGYSFALPLNIEISKGPNWLDQEDLGA
jgi:DNA polymerase I-like protein with 3'-5' exonuclease and polymerase domains